MQARWFLCTGMLLLSACGGGGSSSPNVNPPTTVTSREQDSRTFPLPAEIDFRPLGDVINETDRWLGVLDGAAYRIEVPKQWNGTLIMWARGYWLGATLYIENPLIRRHLIEKGYAWAASSYTRNFYDVNAGIEDTNKLASKFQEIAAAQGRLLNKPARIYVAGWSMGGHVASAAVEAEVIKNAQNPVRYDGALSLCGSVTDIDWFNYIAAYQLAMQKILGYSDGNYPSPAFDQNKRLMQQLVNDSVKKQDISDPRIAKLYALMRNLSGGARPFYREGWSDSSHHDTLFALMNVRPNLDGILATNGLDTRGTEYEFPGVEIDAAELRDFNQTVLRLSAAANANPIQSRGLRWVPEGRGELSAPLMVLHTLGDLTVPVGLQKKYRQRVQSSGRDHLLVQRMIRDVGHCSFTVAEVATAFDDLVKWVEANAVPTGDDLLAPNALQSVDAGCTYTDNRSSTEDRADPAKRLLYQKSYPVCPSR